MKRKAASHIPKWRELQTKETDYAPAVPKPKRPGRKKKRPDLPPVPSEDMNVQEPEPDFSQETAFDDLLSEEDDFLTPIDKNSIMS